LRRGKSGNFEVFLDDERIFSKAETFRFPIREEVLSIIKERLAEGKK
jgi:selT/selW/selH-like putative selenoprotein